MRLELAAVGLTHRVLHKLYMRNILMVLAGVYSNITSTFGSPPTNDIERV